MRDGHHLQREKFMQMFRNTKEYGVLEKVHAWIVVLDCCSGNSDFLSWAECLLHLVGIQSLSVA